MYKNKRKSNLKKKTDALLHFPILATWPTHYDIRLASVILDKVWIKKFPLYNSTNAPLHRLRSVLLFGTLLSTGPPWNLSPFSRILALIGQQPLWTKGATWRQEQKSKPTLGNLQSQNTKKMEILQCAGDVGIVFDLTFNPYFTSNRFSFINVMWLFYVAVLDLSGIKVLLYSWLAWRFWQPTGKTTIMKKNLNVAPFRCVCRCADSSKWVVKET